MQIVFISSRFGRIDLTERVSRWRFSSRAGVGYLQAQFTVNGAERDLHPLMNAVGSDTVEFWAYGQRVWWGYFTGPALAGEGAQANQLQVSAEGPGMRLLDNELWRIFSDVEYGRWDPDANLPAGFAADNNNRVYVGARGIISNGDSGEVAYPEDGVELGAGLVRLRARVLAGFVAGSFEARIEDDDGNELWSTTTDVDEDIDLDLDDVDGLALVLECTADGDSDGYVRLTEVRVQTLDPCTPDAIAGAILDDEGLDYTADASSVDVDASVYQGETALIAIQDQEYLGDGAESWLFLVYDEATFGDWPDDATVCAERKHLPRWEVEYRRADVVNAVRAQLPDGWTSDWTTNDASITQWGRREKTLQLSRMSRTLAAQYAAIYLDEHAWPIAGIKLDAGATILRSDGASWPAVMVRAGDVLCLRDLIGEERTIRVYEAEASSGGMVQITPQGALNRVEYLLATQRRESEEAVSAAGSLSAMATGGASSGDMLKASYDSNDDGQVDSADDADSLGGVAAAAYMTETEHAAVGDSSPHHARYADAEAVSAVEAGIHAATGKATPVDADETALLDSAAAYGLKKLTWANFKATLKTYFDTLYNLYVHPNHSGDVTSSGDGVTTIANKQTLTATAPITVSNTPTVIAGAAPVIAINAATETTHGSVELATVAEARTGTDTTRAVTAAGVAGIIALNTPATDGNVVKSGAGILTLAVASAHTVTVSGNCTLNNWFDQSVKKAASPEFAALVIGGSSVVESLTINVLGTGGTTSAFGGQIIQTSYASLYPALFFKNSNNAITRMFISRGGIGNSSYIDVWSDFNLRVNAAGAAYTSAIYANVLGRVGIGATSLLAKLHVDQESNSAGIPVIYVDQADDDQPFYTLAGKSAAGDSYNLSSATGSSGTVTGPEDDAWEFIGMHRVGIVDASGVLTEGTYWVPLYVAV